MEIAAAQKFLADKHRGVLVARKRDGWPQLTLVTPAIDPAGVSMLVMGEEFGGSKYLQLHGAAEIVSQPEAMELLIYWHRQVRGEHPDWREYRKKMQEEEQVIIRIAIEKVNPSRPLDK